MTQPAKTQPAKTQPAAPREKVVRFVTPVICGGQTLTVVERRERGVHDFLCDDEARRVWVFVELVAGVRGVCWTPYENVAWVGCENDMPTLSTVPR